MWVDTASQKSLTIHLILNVIIRNSDSPVFTQREEINIFPSILSTPVFFSDNNIQLAVQISSRYNLLM